MKEPSSLLSSLYITIFFNILYYWQDKLVCCIILSNHTCIHFYQYIRSYHASSLEYVHIKHEIYRHFKNVKFIKYLEIK